MTEKESGSILGSIRISTPGRISHKPDDKALLEKEVYELESARLDIQDKRQNIDARKTYGKHIFWLVCAWLSITLLVVILAAVGGPIGWFIVSDSVLIALITTTTASVLGLFTIVVNYLFNKG